MPTPWTWGRAAGVLLLLLPGPAAGQPSEPPPPDPAPLPPTAAGACTLPPSLLFTLEALGASSGVPDGVGGSWYPQLPVRGQRAGLGMWTYQAGATLPVYTTATDGLFANAAVRTLGSSTTAILPVSRTRFPDGLWDIQLGGGYVRQLDGGWSWGGFLNAGSASDQPFHSLAEDTISGLGFVRVPRTDQTGWLFYVVSTTTGQFGHNLPIPGVAYEFRSDRLSGVVGFPFVNINYRPIRPVEFDFNYTALTDILARVTVHPADPVRVFTAFEWTNQSWLRAGRRVRSDQLFWYEKRLEGGLGWAAGGRADLRLTGGYAFGRYFVENNGFSLTGRNRIDLAPGPFVAAQLELRY